ncbi:uncharacterized protein PHA67_022771 [Liasis olivaceus]
MGQPPAEQPLFTHSKRMPRTMRCSVLPAAEQDAVRCPLQSSSEVGTCAHLYTFYLPAPVLPGGGPLSPRRNPAEGLGCARLSLRRSADGLLAPRADGRWRRGSVAAGLPGTVVGFRAWIGSRPWEPPGLPPCRCGGCERAGNQAPCAVKSQFTRVSTVPGYKRARITIQSEEKE